MTQIAALSTARRTTSGRKMFILDVYNKVGDRLLETYSSDNPGGISGGFVSRMFPNGTCGAMTFEAKPRDTAIEQGNILYLYFDTGFKVVPLHMGVVTSSPDPRSGDRGTYEVSSGKTLLRRSVVPPDIPLYADGDVGKWLQYLVGFFKHPALKYRAELIPLTGVITNGSEARGTNLYEAIQAILKAVPTIGDNDWGVDPDGFVIIAPPTDEIALPYTDVRAQFNNNIDATDVVTKAVIRVANEVSEGAIVSAGYRPSLITYSYEHPDHIEWRAERSFDLPKNAEDKPVIDVLEYSPSTGFSWDGSANGWKASTTNQPANVAAVCTDSSLDTYAYNGTNIPTVLQVLPGNPKGFVGAALVIDAAVGSYDLSLEIYNGQFVGSVVTSQTVKFDLNHLKGQGKVEARFIAPSSSTLNLSQVDARLNLTGTSVTTNAVKVYELRGLEANETLLEQIARAQIRLAAKETTEITCAQGFANDGTPYGGFLLERVGKTITLSGADPPVSGTIAEFVHTITDKEGALTRIYTGNPLRSAQFRMIENMVRGV